MSVREILNAMDKLTPEELRIVKLGVDSRFSGDEEDPALLASLKKTIAYFEGLLAEPGLREVLAAEKS